MRRVTNIPFFIFLIANIAYIYIIGVVNSSLAPYASLLLPSVFIIGPALYLKSWQTVLTILITALLWESTTPVRTGLVCAVWLLAAWAVRIVRFKYRALDRMSLCALAEVVNFAIIMAYLAIFPNGCANFSDYVFRIFSDSLLSALILIFAARFAVLVPLSFMKIAGIELKIEEEN